MSTYKVAHRYAAVYRSQPIAFDEGATVEVDDDTAEWVNRDSPGCLVAAKAKDEKPADDSKRSGRAGA